ncbi:MAG: CBS domain-containing protein, partial [Planctomycetota bacterium]|nr:CBS domain-containing protein [Planctomycetota bacterium]
CIRDSPVTVRPSDTLLTARTRMEATRCRRLPVLDDQGHLCGIITDRDLRLATHSPLVLRERWEDAEYVAELAVANVMNTDYLGDALPACWPNLGPDVFSAFLGTELEYGETTSWSKPILHDWRDAPKIRFSEDNYYWRKILEMTDALLAAGKNKFYTGITDIHPGGDAIAALRDPLQLNMDLIDSPAEVKRLLHYVNEVYFRVFDFFCDKLQGAGQAITSWPGIVSTRRWYVPSNDFSCMISKQMFDEFFLDGIAAECRHTAASVYHLDGPGALQHLDSLLAIPELNAIQWVPGAGHGGVKEWLSVYKKCQAAGKGLQIFLSVDEWEIIRKELRPEGLWLGIYGLRNAEEAETLLRQATRWR